MIVQRNFMTLEYSAINLIFSCLTSSYVYSRSYLVLSCNESGVHTVHILILEYAVIL